MQRTRIPAIDARGGVSLSVLLLLVTCGLWGAAQVPDVSFGGFFELMVISTQTAPMTAKGISVQTSLAIGDFTTQVNASFTDTLSDRVSFSANGLLGEIALSSTATFNPSTAEFLSWQTGMSFTFLDVDASDVLYVTKPQTASYNLLTLSGVLGDVSFQVGTKLGICPLAFWEASVCADWPWADCDATLGACMQVTDTAGVQSIDFTMADLLLFENLLGMRWNLSVVLSFTPEEKTLTPTLNLQPDWFLCTDIELLGEISGGSSVASIESVLVYGIRGECTLGEDTTIQFADSLVDEKNSSLTGKAEYFELIGISGPLPSCCGSMGTFHLTAYFERPPAPSSALFGLGLISGSFDVQIASSFALSFEAEFPTVGSGWRITWGFRVIW